jgi:prophage regulatory protein|tara:strand:+ start:2366 stop:2563 length:198 start_codon:yes stop_codon:yes gene_type:complete
MENQMSELYRVKTLSKKLDMGVSTIWKMVKSGNFPKPISLGERFTAWRSEDVQQWLDSLNQSDKG